VDPIGGLPDAGGGGGGPTCMPGYRVCVGNAVYVCSDDGVPGAMVETCSTSCTNGACDGGGDTGGGDTGGGDACGDQASEFVYVVDNANTLYRFDPAGDAHTFTTIGTLRCPAGPPLGGALGAATPFSMSVDRDATAWVLYSSGEIFKVSTQDATCSPTGFQKQQGGYDLMGMGFVSDSPGSESEKLYVAGSTLDPASGQLLNTKLGFVPKDTLRVNHITDLVVENPPELTGTGEAKLYGYFPGTASTVSEIDKTTGQRVAGQQWPAGAITANETLNGWAFAQWGGRFYVFVTVTAGVFGTPQGRVVRVDPSTGTATVVKNTGVPYVVGAGVSTCAPVIVE
jgi:hypothetical protein